MGFVKEGVIVLGGMFLLVDLGERREKRTVMRVDLGMDYCCW